MSSKTDRSPAAPLLPVLLESLALRLAAETDTRRWIIAFSGGLDSSLLLELCARLKLPQPLLAIHVDHQLQAASSDWAEHCLRQCRRLNIPLHIRHVQPASASEAAARDARYRVFESLLQPGDCLLLAQHADDQAETLLLRLLRGAGVAGLAGMPATRVLGQGRLLRPLLALSRAQLEQGAAELGLVSVEDPSNARDHYDRNWLRLHILPGLKQRWPGLLQRCGDTAALMGEADELLRERAEEDYRTCRLESAAGGTALSLSALRQLSTARQRNLLHHWLAEHSGQRVARQRLLSLMQSMLSPRVDAEPVERLKKVQLRRYRDGLYLLPDPLPVPGEPVQVMVGQSLTLALGRLSWRRVGPNERGLAEGRILTLTYRQGGERLRPLGRGGSVSLKQYLQEAEVPPWLRPLQPLLLLDGELLALPGIGRCEGPWVENGWLPEWDAFGLS